MPVTALTDTTFDEAIGAESAPILIDFTAAWCPPCKAIAPILEELSVDLAGALRVVKVDVDESPATAMRFGIRSMPTLVVLRDGAEIKRLVGARPKRVLLEDLADVV